MWIPKCDLSALASHRQPYCVRVASVRVRLCLYYSGCCIRPRPRRIHPLSLSLTKDARSPLQQALLATLHSTRSADSLWDQGDARRNTRILRPLGETLRSPNRSIRRWIGAEFWPTSRGTCAGSARLHRIAPLLSQILPPRATASHFAIPRSFGGVSHVNMPFIPEHSLMTVKTDSLGSIDTTSVENLFGVVSSPPARSPPPRAVTDGRASGPYYLKHRMRSRTGSD